MFLIVIDTVMRNVNQDRWQGIQWGLVNRLEDLDFVDDMGLLSESHGDMQTMLDDLTNKAEKVRLIINVKKKALRIKTSKTDPFTLRDKSIEDVDSLHTWAVWMPKMELRKMSRNKFEKQMVLSYKFIQCERIAKYLLG